MQAFRKILYSFTLFLLGPQIQAQGVCEHWIGKFAPDYQEWADIRRVGSSSWQLTRSGECNCDMDTIGAGRNSRVVKILNTYVSYKTPVHNFGQNTFLIFNSRVIGDCGPFFYRLVEHGRLS